ncbi:hypothetical protein [Kitasatospora indigofera]|uniref:hypothetical protein n=1 Tax=Kitasatospora indigofera TaxID=67307 RepID=UPI0033BF6295
MADKEKPAEPEGFQAPKNADYDTWDSAAILHIFRGQDKGYSSEKSAGWSAPEPETLFQAREAVIDASVAMTDAHQIISQLSRQMERGDYWSGPTATMFSNLLSRAETVLVEHATALDHHQVRLDESGRVLAAVQDGVLEIWHAATRAVGLWWSGLNLSQQMEWMKTHDYPPVQEKESGGAFYRVGDFPTIMEPMTQGMRDLLKTLAGTYRTGIVNMPSPGSPEFSGAGSPAGGPGGVLPAPPKLGDLSVLGADTGPSPTLEPLPDAPRLGDAGLGGVDGGAGDPGARQLRELSGLGGGVGDLGSPQLGDLSGLGGAGGAGAGLGGGAGGVGDLGSPQLGDLSGLGGAGGAGAGLGGGAGGVGDLGSPQLGDLSGLGGAGGVGAGLSGAGDGMSLPGAPQMGGLSSGLGGVGGGSAGGGVGGVGPVAMPPLPTLGGAGAGSGFGSGASGGAGTGSQARSQSNPVSLPPAPQLGNMSGLGGAGGAAGLSAGGLGGVGGGSAGGGVGGVGPVAMPPLPKLGSGSGVGAGSGLGGGAGTGGQARSQPVSLPPAPQLGALRSSSTGLGSSAGGIGTPGRLPGLDPSFSNLGGGVGASEAAGRSGVRVPGLGSSALPRLPGASGAFEGALLGPSKFDPNLKPTPLENEFAGLLRSDPKVAGLTATAGQVGRVATAEAMAARAAASEGAVAGRIGAGMGPGGATGAMGGMGGMPYMPPMTGAGGQRQTDGERERTTWLLEDDEVWGTDGAECHGGVIGRSPQN